MPNKLERPDPSEIKVVKGSSTNNQLELIQTDHRGSLFVSGLVEHDLGHSSKEGQELQGHKSDWKNNTTRAEKHSPQGNNQ